MTESQKLKIIKDKMTVLIFSECEKAGLDYYYADLILDCVKGEIASKGWSMATSQILEMESEEHKTGTVEDLKKDLQESEIHD